MRNCLKLSLIFTLVFFMNGLQAQINLSNVIEEIVVTSTKKDTTLQDTPVSVSVIQVEDIERLAVSDI